MIHERESELINYDIVDSTSTIPTVPKLEIPSDQTKQPEFILDTVEAPSIISGVDSMVQAYLEPLGVLLILEKTYCLISSVKK